MHKVFYSQGSQNLTDIAREVLKSLGNTNLILLKGQLGAGKTTFAQAFLNELGAEGPFTSPTFVVMKQYPLDSKKIKMAYHFDCYRVGAVDIQQLGWEEILTNKKNILLVEWPEKICSIISNNEKHCLIDFEIVNSTNRKITVQFND